MKRKLITLIIITVFTLQLQAQKYVGGDISMLPKYEEAGVVYKDKTGATDSDPLAFFKQEGGGAQKVLHKGRLGRQHERPDNRK